MKYTRLIILAFALLGAVPSFLHAQVAGVEWSILNQEVIEFYRADKYDRAVLVAEKALQVAEQNVGPEHPDEATILNKYLDFLLYDLEGIGASYECDSGGNMREMEVCASEELEDAKDVLREIFSASFKYLYESQSNDLYPELVEMLSDSQMKWLSYVDAKCEAEMLSSGYGTIATFSRLRCETRHTRERAVYLWHFYLQPTPSTSYSEPPVPKPVFKNFLD